MIIDAALADAAGSSHSASGIRDTIVIGIDWGAIVRRNMEGLSMKMAIECEGPAASVGQWSLLRGRMANGASRSYSRHRWRARWVLAGALLLTLGGVARSQEAPAGEVPAKAPIRQITEDLFELGKVRFDKKEKSVTFPATVNMKEGLIEYLVVHARGKAHESLLITETEPYHIHLAVLLLSGKSTPEKVDGAKTDEPAAARNVKVTLRPTGGKNAAGEDWVFDLHAKAPMVQGNWRYAGSRVVDGVFLAQRDGSIVSVIDDGDALINNARPRSDNDENWQIYAERVPAIGTEVQVVIQLVSAKAETK